MWLKPKNLYFFSKYKFDFVYLSKYLTSEFEPHPPGETTKQSGFFSKEKKDTFNFLFNPLIG